ncbi:hypothetical protein [Kribbella voronezhensis]|uniref:hypothetical protein n=1 Tax=Kribbella voronezhensis TaxID=2512212 RepID=UPI001417007E|nr:hypothetical protein [Kribbella voronezhensis]
MPSARTGGVSLPAILVAGGTEGAMLGFGQSSVLRLALPELSCRRWITTAAITGLALRRLTKVQP